MTYEFNGIEHEDETYVDLGGGMVVRLAELLEEDDDVPKPHPPRNRGEGTGVDGLMPVGQEDTPKR